MDYAPRPSKRLRLDRAVLNPTNHSVVTSRDRNSLTNDDPLWGNDDITAEEFDFLQSQVESQLESKDLQDQRNRALKSCPLGLLGSSPTDGETSTDVHTKQDVGVSVDVEKYKSQLKELQEHQDAREGKLRMLQVELLQKSTELEQERSDKQRLLDRQAKDFKQQLLEMNRSIERLKTELQFKEQEVLSAQEKIQGLEQQLAKKGTDFCNSQDRIKVATNKLNFRTPKKKECNLRNVESVPTVDQCVQTAAGNVETKMVRLQICNRGKKLTSSVLSSILMDCQDQPDFIDCRKSDRSTPFGSSARLACLCLHFWSQRGIGNGYKRLCSATSQMVIPCDILPREHVCQGTSPTCGPEVDLLRYVRSCLTHCLEFENASSRRSGDVFDSTSGSVVEKGPTRVSACGDECSTFRSIWKACSASLNLLRKLFLYSPCARQALLRKNDVGDQQGQTHTESQMQREEVVGLVLHLIHCCCTSENKTASIPLLENALNLLQTIFVVNASSFVESFPDALEKINFGSLASGKFGFKASRYATDILTSLIPNKILLAVTSKCSDNCICVLQGLSRCLHLIYTSKDTRPPPLLLSTIIEFLTGTLYLYSPFEVHNCTSACWPEVIQSLIHALYQELQIFYANRSAAPPSPCDSCFHKGSVLLLLMSTKFSPSVFQEYRSKAEDFYACLMCGLARLCKSLNQKSTLDIVHDLWDFGSEDAEEFESVETEEVAET